MADIDLSKAAGEFEQTPEEAAAHAAAVKAYEEKKAAKLAAKGGVVAAPSSQLVISFVLTNLIRQKGETPIPADQQAKVDAAFVAWVRKNVTERKRYDRIKWTDGHAVSGLFGGALRVVTLSGKMLNEYSTEELFDEDEYKSWKRNPTGEPKDEDDDEDDYDDYDEDEEDEEEEEDEEQEEGSADPEKVAAAYIEATDAALKKFTEATAEAWEEAIKADAEVDAKPGLAYYNFLHIPKVTSAKLDRLSND